MRQTARGYAAALELWTEHGIETVAACRGNKMKHSRGVTNSLSMSRERKQAILLT